RAAPFSAVLLTVAIVVFLLVPVGYLLYRGLRELPQLVQLWTSSRDQGLPVPAWLAGIPGIGAWAVREWQQTLGEPGALASTRRGALGGLDFAAGRTVVAVLGRHAMALF